MPTPLVKTLEEAEANSEHYLKTLLAIADELVEIDHIDLTPAEIRIAEILKHQGLLDESNGMYHKKR